MLTSTITNTFLCRHCASSYQGLVCWCLHPPGHMNPTDSEIAAAQALLQREVQWPPYSSIYDAVDNGKLMTMEQEELHKMARIFCLALHIARKQGRFDILAGHLAKGQKGMEAPVVADFHRNEVHAFFVFFRLV